LKEVEKMDKAIKEILFSEEKIKTRVMELAEEISKDYPGGNKIFIGVLKGSVMFVADLMRCMESNVTMDFMSVSSYGVSTSSSGIVRILKDLDFDIEGRDVFIIEDIIDSGNTLKYLYEYLKARNPNIIKICCLLDKPDRRTAQIKADYVGFEIPDAFVVGYGLDYDEKFRNLPYIGILKEEVYK
jgi:hypoxanthine phosphoribosyltransferase